MFATPAFAQTTAGAATGIAGLPEPFGSLLFFVPLFVLFYFLMIRPQQQRMKAHQALVAGVKRVVVVMDHCEKSGAPKLLKRCNLPLTGAGVVDLLITDLGVFEIGGGEVTLIELATGESIEGVRTRTEAEFKVAPSVG